MDKRKFKGRDCKRFKDKTGQRFGKLLVIGLNEIRASNRHLRYDCKCDCGNIKTIVVDSLVQNASKSCGCEHFKKGKIHPAYRGYEDISSKYWSSVKAGAAIRNLDFNITIEDAWKLFLQQHKKCKFTGLELKFKEQTTDKTHTASLDRRDSTKGYIKGNLQWIHKKIQGMKMAITDEEFIHFCKLVAKHKK